MVIRNVSCRFAILNVLSLGKETHATQFFRGTNRLCCPPVHLMAFIWMIRSIKRTSKQLVRQGRHKLKQ